MCSGQDLSPPKSRIPAAGGPSKFLFSALDVVCSSIQIILFCFPYPLQGGNWYLLFLVFQLVAWQIVWKKLKRVVNKFQMEL